MSSHILMPLTSNSFSAVGLFLGFLVKATLTKLWKVGLLKKKERKKNVTLIYVHLRNNSHATAIQIHNTQT
jgi:hypothetical protein